MKIGWLPEAEGNLESQLSYIAERNPRAAIVMGPASAPPGRVRGTRELVVTGTPYVVVYRVERAVVVILRVLHGAQRWPPNR